MLIKIFIWFILLLVCNGNIVNDLYKNIIPDKYKFVKRINIPRKLIPLTRRHFKNVIRLHRPYKYKHFWINEIHKLRDNKHAVLLGKFKSQNVAIRCDKKTCDFFEEKN
tara:strand:- start:1181 stop:1507 length:327 start_codon:yes stop_codon:yes gene_type:complete